VKSRFYDWSLKAFDSFETSFDILNDSF